MVCIWRHPKPVATDGVCIGQTDVSVDKRKLKRLANKIQRFVRVEQLPKVIWVSPLQRSLKVGEILAQRGFECRVAPELAEIDFGAWEGRAWSEIGQQEIDDWCDDFADFAPKNGENLRQLFKRVEQWLGEVYVDPVQQSVQQPDSPILAIGHAGWINAAKLILAAKDIPKSATEWPRSVGYQSCTRL